VNSVRSRKEALMKALKIEKKQEKGRATAFFKQVTT